MIEAVPTRLLSRHYRLSSPAGDWTELRFDAPAGDAGFVLDGRAYRAVWERGETGMLPFILRGVRGRHRYRLEADGQVVARAEGGGLRPRFRIWSEPGPEYLLRLEGKQMELLRDGERLGQIGSRGGLSRGVWARLSPAVPAPIAVFAIWLMVRQWETLHTE